MTNNRIHKIGIFGGSFNPPHIGHVLAVQFVKSVSDFEGIFVIPCGNHAFGKNLLSFEHRFEMCKLAFLNIRQDITVLDGFGISQNNIVISDLENTNDISYSIDTAKLIKQKIENLKEGEVQLNWIIGSDCAKKVDKWKDIKELKKIVNFYEIPRSDSKLIFDSKSILPCISSTEVRKKISENKDVSTLVPRLVSKYIKENKLYMAV
jgi:nicotinate-nucleotide adenylyltransferase